MAQYQNHLYCKHLKMKHDEFVLPSAGSLYEKEIIDEMRNTSSSIRNTSEECDADEVLWSCIRLILWLYLVIDIDHISTWSGLKEPAGRSMCSYQFRNCMSRLTASYCDPSSASGLQHPTGPPIRRERERDQRDVMLRPWVQTLI